MKAWLVVSEVVLVQVFQSVELAFVHEFPFAELVELAEGAE